KQAGARVPEKFLQVQWSRLPGGQPTPAFEALCRRLAAGESPGPQPAKQAGVAAARRASPSARGEYPPFPKEEPGQRTRFGFHVAGWTLHCAWVAFSRLPKWIRVIAYVWLFVLLLAKACSPNGSHGGRVDDSKTLSPAATRRLKNIAEQYQGSSNP